MQERTEKIRKENTDARRADLISATLCVISRDGVRAATVRTISKEAKVTQGLIRYYFRSKNDLIMAAYELYMGGLVADADKASHAEGTARERLAKFVQVSLEAPVTSHASISIWVGFFETLLHDEEMTDSHNRSYDLLRLHLKSLIADVFDEVGIQASDQRLRRLSIACNAVLDGLWMEGGALPNAFEDGELILTGLESFSALLQVDLFDHP